MSSFTNKERISQNNAKIEQLIELIETKTPSGTIEINENGSYNVTKYAEANVNVEAIKNYGYQIETEYEVDESGNKTQVLNIYEGIDPEEYEPNADMVWAKSVCENDVQEGYTYKVLQMLGDVSPTSDINIPINGAVKTSDGAFYTYTDYGSNVTHTWNDTNARVSESYKAIYNKVRWIISYSKNQKIVNNPYAFTLESRSIYLCYDGLEFKGRQDLKLLEYADFINGAKTGDGYSFYQCYNLKGIPKTLILGSTITSCFGKCYSLKTIPKLDTSNNTHFSSIFTECYSLKEIPLLDTSKSTGFPAMFYGCSSLEKVPQLDTSNSKSFNNMFGTCRSLKTIPYLNTSNGTDFSYMFNECHSLEKVPQLDTNKGTSFNYMFFQCNLLETIPLINLINATNISNLIGYCYKIKNLTLKNIKLSLQVGSGTSWGHLLTLDSLTNTIKELWDNSSGTSTLTLTVGTANLEKLANVYVKLIDITDKMRTEDEYIDNKKPFVLCESTDEGAMLITEYVTSKNWQLA